VSHLGLEYSLLRAEYMWGVSRLAHTDFCRCTLLYLVDPVYLPDPYLPGVAAVGDDIDGRQRPLWMPVYAEHHA
jgi:hypothetical protein